MDLILASGSPRRREYIANLGIPFQVIVPNVDESSSEDEKPWELVERLSKLKAQAIARIKTDSVVIAADTVVAIDDIIIGKPKDRKDAFEMLKRLSGRDHFVYTGTTVQKGDRVKSFVVCTKVTFDKLDDELIKNYVSSGECDDKAGAYAIQGLAASLISKVEGSVSSVVGLPINEVVNAIREFGIIPKFKKV